MVNPAIMIIAATRRLKDLILRNGALMMMESPMQWRTPKRIGLSGRNIAVSKVNSIPRLKIQSPRWMLRRYNFFG